MRPCIEQFNDLLELWNDCLAKAANGAPSPATIHQLRVTTRKLEAGLAVCKPWLADSFAKWLRKICQRLRTASNAVRDADVAVQLFSQHPAKKKILTRLRNRRLVAMQALVQRVGRMSRGRKWKRWMRGGSTGQPRPFLRTADRPDVREDRHRLLSEIMELCSHFCSLTAGACHDQRCWHRWRIAAKRLRYVCEYLETAGCTELSTAVTALKELQEQLGQVLDQQRLGRDASVASIEPVPLMERWVALAAAAERTVCLACGSLVGCG